MQEQSKRKQRSKEAMIALVQSYDSSQETQKAFCAREDISPSVFHYWRKKLITEKEPTHTASFLPISIESSKSAEQLKIVLPNGITLEIPIG